MRVEQEEDSSLDQETDQELSIRLKGSLELLARVEESIMDNLRTLQEKAAGMDEIARTLHGFLERNEELSRLNREITSRLTASAAPFIKAQADVARQASRAVLPSEDLRKALDSITRWFPEIAKLAGEMRIAEMSRDQIVMQLETGAQKRVGMSAAALLTAYREGKLEDPGEVADLLVLADLLPDDDPVFAAA